MKRTLKIISCSVLPLYAAEAGFIAGYPTDEKAAELF